MVQWSRMLSVEPHSEESLFHIILFRTSTVVQGCHYFFLFLSRFCCFSCSFFLLSSFLCFLSFFPFSPSLISSYYGLDEIYGWSFCLCNLHVEIWHICSHISIFVGMTVKCCWNITIIYRGLKSEVFGKLCAWKCTLVFFRHIYQAFIMESNCLCYL